MLNIEAKFEGADLVLSAIGRTQKVLGSKTSDVMAEVARDVKGAAESRASSRRVHNLWRAKGGRTLVPRYRVKQEGAYMFKVETSGGAVGRGEAISEFAAEAITPQGGGMVRALNRAYGSTGRILWHSYDELSAELAAKFDKAVEAAAAEISKETS